MKFYPEVSAIVRRIPDGNDISTVPPFDAPMSFEYDKTVAHRIHVAIDGYRLHDIPVDAIAAGPRAYLSVVAYICGAGRNGETARDMRIVATRDTVKLGGFPVYLDAEAPVDSVRVLSSSVAIGRHPVPVADAEVTP